MSQQKEAVYTQPVDTIIDDYDVQQDQGLSQQEAESRIEQYGKNKLREAEQRGVWDILIDQFKNIVIYLLAVAAIAALAFGDVVEAIAILIAIIVNAAIGFFTELRAVRSMEALREMSQVQAKVRRDGEIREVDAEELVPGDVLFLEEGDVISADARVIKSEKLQVDESPLTGESVPVSKQVEPVEQDTELAERSSMLYKGTTVTRGGGEAVVVATGMETELGHISELVEGASGETTPLEERLDSLGGRLAYLTLAVAALIAVVGLIAGRELRVMVETSIALAVAAIPEGLPIVATIALARGMKRMADRNALVNKLETVETLGATNVILTDKTGTLTENDMVVNKLVLDAGTFALEDEAYTQDGEQVTVEDNAQLKEAIKLGVLCNNASLRGEGADADSLSGDPLEVALIRAGRHADLRRDELLEELPEEREIAFDRETTMMATFHKQDGDYLVAVKGAPEAVIDAATRIRTAEGDTRDFDDDARQRWRDHNTELASDGLRMLALATKQASSTDDDPYTDMVFIGLVGLYDPPREDVADAIQETRDAGIEVVMVTGDQPETAENIARQIGLVNKEGDVAVIRGKDLDTNGNREKVLDTPVFARITPEQKLDLIAVHQDAGHRVAMTGDGVNDAPALQKADIGIAMGQRGTQAAKEAADMVLQDDALGTITLAVKQGRIIFGNIRKFIMYLLSENLSQIIIVGVAALLSAPLPLRPLVILFLNAVIDVFPALALGVGEGRDKAMNNPPRDPDEPILTRTHWLTIAGYSTLIGTVTLAVYAFMLNAEPVGESGDSLIAVTVTYLTLAFGRLFHVFNMRDNDEPIFDNQVTRNKWVWGAVVLSVVLILGSVYIPGINTVLETTPPPVEYWSLILGGAILPVIIIQIVKSLMGRRESAE